MKGNKKTGKRIPISTAKRICEEYGYSQVIIHAFDIETGIQHVTTFGKSIEDCDNAAKGGNAIKKMLGWPDELCHDKPARIKRRDKK